MDSLHEAISLAAARDKWGRNAVLMAAETSNLALFRHLVVRHGMDPAAVEDDQFNAILWVARNGEIEMLDAFVDEYGVDGLWTAWRWTLQQPLLGDCPGQYQLGGRILRSLRSCLTFSLSFLCLAWSQVWPRCLGYRQIQQGWSGFDAYLWL